MLFGMVRREPCIFPATADRFEDYLRVPLSLGLAAMRSWKLVLFAVTPYVLLVVTFGGFVVWNGGVVLGKEETADML